MVSNAALEGDDFDISERAIRVILYGSQFASCDDGDALGMCASGPEPLATLAMRLFQAGFSPERPLVLFRGGERVGSTTIGKAAGVIDA
jgi:hypothetical protein